MSKFLDEVNVDALIHGVEDEVIYAGKFLMIFNQSSGWSIDAMRTEPYEADGSVPIVFFNLGYFQLMLEWLWLYKIVYKWQYGWEIE